MTFLELKSKEVINVCDGRRLGCICDIMMEEQTCRVTAIIVPGCTNLFRFFNRKNIVIPWCNIRKIGDDVILVDAGDLCCKT